MVFQPDVEGFDDVTVADFGGRDRAIVHQKLDRNEIAIDKNRVTVGEIPIARRTLIIESKTSDPDRQNARSSGANAVGEARKAIRRGRTQAVRPCQKLKRNWPMGCGWAPRHLHAFKVERQVGRRLQVACAKALAVAAAIGPRPL